LFSLAAAQARHDPRAGTDRFPATARIDSLALVRVARMDQPPRLFIAGGSLIVELLLPTGQPGLALACRLSLGSHDIAFLHRHAHRTGNQDRSRRVITGLLLLLAVCGFIAGGEEGARRAVSGGAPAPGGPVISPETMERRFGARLLRPAEMPALFAMLRDICARAGLARMPDLYYLAGPASMNAYALGGPDGSAITLTEGLLRGMTLDEIAGILAHEVAHIRNNDAWAMTWATGLNRATALTSLVALVSLQAQGRQAPASAKLLPLLLASAPAIGQLLCLALSRIRELDADAAALDLIDDPRALMAALHKLERHHTGAPALPASPLDSNLRFLCSHPATWERLGILASLAH
jgi:heat shock protein HtpX